MSTRPHWIDRVVRKPERRFVNLNAAELDDWPAELLQLTELRSLVLLSNNFEAIPDSLLTHAKLEKLHLAKNPLKRLNPELHRLTQLRSLNLMGCDQLDFDRAADDIARCPRLEKLILSHCQLTALPLAIAEMSSLRVLELHGNQLVELPPALAKNRRLQKITLDANPVDPKEVATLPFCSPDLAIWFSDTHRWSTAGGMQTRPPFDFDDMCYPAPWSEAS